MCFAETHSNQCYVNTRSVEETTPTESERPLEGAAAVVRVRMCASLFAFMVI